MLQQLMLWVTEYGNAVKNNPVLALFAVYFTGVGTYLLRNVPKQIYHFIMTQGTTVLELDNTGHEGNMLQYAAFVNWYSKTKWFKQSRTIFIGALGSNSISEELTRVYGPGSGFHFFFVGMRLFWFEITSIESQGSERIKKKINIRTFGRSHDHLNKLIDAFEYKEMKDGKLSIYSWRASYERWESHPIRVKRDMNTVVLKKEIKSDIIKRVIDFTNSRQWYLDRNLPYKLSLLFRGPPGTGKTSVAKAVACMVSRDIYILDPSIMSNSLLIKALGSIKPGSAVLIEDIDASTKAAMKRTDDNEVPTDMTVTKFDVEKLTLSGLLNALDGIIELNDVIVLTTTNHYERLDPALLRKSRIDHDYQIDNFTYLEAQEYFRVMYPDAIGREVSITESNFTEMPGCDVQAIFKNNPHDPDGFINEIIKKKPGLEIAA